MIADRIYYVCVIGISTAIWISSAYCSIQLKAHEDGQRLSAPTTELLSSLKQCIVFVFDWVVGNDNFNSTSTKYFIFYSEYLSCSLVVETLLIHRNGTFRNPRFSAKLSPHPLFTKYTKILLNFYSTASTSIDYLGHPATAYIEQLIRLYNIAFNYVLIFMTNERFSNVDTRVMFKKCLKPSAPAVYILVLDEHNVYVVGFAHVLQSAQYLFKVSTFKESDIRHVHETVHKDLQHSKIQLVSGVAPKVCSFGLPIADLASECVFRTLVKNYNATFCTLFSSSCSSQIITVVALNTVLSSDTLYTRRHDKNLEFINYSVDTLEFSFLCIVQVGRIGLMAFVQAFDLSTWIATTAACTSLAVVVALMSNKKTFSWLTQLEPSVVVVIMLLLERFYTNAQLRRAASRRMLLILTVWAFAAMLLGMSYSGNIISELAAPSLPTIPKNMHELSQVAYPIYSTFSEDLLKDDGSHITGYLDHSIEQYLAKNIGGTLTTELRALGMVIDHVKPEEVPIGEPDISQGSKTLFAVADNTPRIKGLGIRTMLASSGLRASPAEDLPFFNSIMAVSMDSGPLLKIFRKFLANLYEPGIWKYWKEGYDANLTKSGFWTQSYKNNAVLGQAWVRRLNLAELWRSFSPLLDGAASSSPIGVDNLIPVFQLVGIGFFMSTFVLLNERWPLPVVA